MNPQIEILGCLPRARFLGRRYSPVAGGGEEDLTQAALLEACQSLETWDPEAGMPLVGYVWRHLDRRVRDKAQDERRERHDSLDRPLPGYSNLRVGDTLPAPNTRTREGEAEWGRFRELLLRLPPVDCYCVTARARGATDIEIAGVLDRTRAFVWEHRTRAEECLRSWALGRERDD